MQDREALQQEILKELISYSENLIPAVQIVIEELRGKEIEDTKTFLEEIVIGINWEIEVYNQCASLINEKSDYIDRRAMIQAVKELGSSLNTGDNGRIAECLEQHFLPFLNKMSLAAEAVLQESVHS